MKSIQLNPDGTFPRFRTAEVKADNITYMVTATASTQDFEPEPEAEKAFWKRLAEELEVKRSLELIFGCFVIFATFEEFIRLIVWFVKFCINNF